jgi:hypothetical protein
MAKSKSTPKPKPEEEKPSKGPETNHYERAARMLIDKPDTDIDKLARAINVTKSRARYCIKAWKQITQVLVEKGWLTLPEVSKDAPAATTTSTTKAPAAEQPKPAAKLAQGDTKQDAPQSVAAVEEAKAA